MIIGLGGEATVIGTVGTPSRALMLMSHPIMYIPMRSSETETSWPSPVRSRAKSAADTAPAAARPAMWSPMPPRWYGSGVPSGVRAAATPARDQKAPTSYAAAVAVVADQAVAGDVGIDEAGVALRHGVVVEAGPGERGGTGVGDEHVGVRRRAPPRAPGPRRGTG